MFTPNDKNLISQMIKAGRYNAIHDLVVENNKQKVKEVIKKMGPKWCLHKDNQIKRLEVPLS